MGIWRKRMWAAFLVCVAGVGIGPRLVLAAPGRAKIPDGTYSWTEGPGKQVVRNDGARVVLGPRLGDKLGTAAIRSVKNDNSRFRLELIGAGPLEKPSGPSYLAVVIDGVCLAVWAQSELAPNGTVNLTCTIHGEKVAENIAEKLKVELVRRKHPGHRFEVQWSPEKAEYPMGEPVTLKMEIRNTGTAPFTFQVGGRQRGPRDNQFRFLAYRSYGGGKAVPDTGDPVNFGGISYHKTLKPGESFSRSIALDKWFTFNDPDIYRITGMFEMPIVLESSTGTIWDELAAGDCLVHVVKKK
jgi:hypothetical protein